MLALWGKKWDIFEMITVDSSPEGFVNGLLSGMDTHIVLCAVTIALGMDFVVQSKNEIPIVCNFVELNQCYFVFVVQLIKVLVLVLKFLYHPAEDKRPITGVRFKTDDSLHTTIYSTTTKIIVCAIYSTTMF